METNKGDGSNREIELRDETYYVRRNVEMRSDRICRRGAPDGESNYALTPVTPPLIGSPSRLLYGSSKISRKSRTFVAKLRAQLQSQL